MKMVWIIIGLLVLLWIFGTLLKFTMKGLIHLLLLAAILLLVIILLV